MTMITSKCIQRPTEESGFHCAQQNYNPKQNPPNRQKGKILFHRSDRLFHTFEENKKQDFKIQYLIKQVARVEMFAQLHENNRREEKSALNEFHKFQKAEPNNFQALKTLSSLQLLLCHTVRVCIYIYVSPARSICHCVDGACGTVTPAFLSSLVCYTHSHKHTPTHEHTHKQGPLCFPPARH